MRRILVIVVALTLMLSLWATCLMAEEHAGAERERDNDGLLAELAHLREENRALREEVRELKDDMIRLMSDQIERQQEQINSMRGMLEQQYEFMQGIIRAEFELRMAQQQMGMREFEMERRNDEGNIERELNEIRSAVERDPNNPELRTKLGNVLWEVGDFHGAFEQYKTALSINPDFGPAFEAMERLREEFPDLSREMREREPERDREPERERERPVEDAAGTVISANKEELKLKTWEGEIITFRVPFIRRDDGSWALNEDLAHFVGSLEPGARVGLLWEEVEGRRVIRRIEPLEEER